MRRAIQILVLSTILGGCTSVRLVQREGCWIRETSGTLRGTVEEIGPCDPPQPEWSDDRLTRVVQECVARAEHRWQTRALIAWNQGQPIPERGTDGSVLQACMDETSRALSSDNDRLRQQNELLSSKVKEVGTERDALRTRADDASAKLLATHEKMSDRLLGDQEKLGERVMGTQDKLAGYLGEAAKKASQPAVATASATSSSDGAVTTDASNAAAPTTPATVVAVPVPSAPAVPTRAAPRPSRSAPPAAALAPAKCSTEPPRAAARQARRVRKASSAAADPCSASVDPTPPASAARR